MKKRISILAVLLTILVIGIWANKLNDEALQVQRTDPGGYLVIKEAAIEDHPYDYALQLWEINRQCKAFVEVFLNDDQVDSDVLMLAHVEFIKVTQEEWAALVDVAIREHKPYAFLYGPTDWAMVQWEYDRQMKARGSF